ncbi:MAG: class B sortase [bacterium]|nr:class B sortase [bacterium]
MHGNKRQWDKGEEQRGKSAWRLVAGVCGVCFLCCLVWLIYYVVNNHRAAENVESLRQKYVTPVAGDEARSDSTAPQERQEEPEPTPSPTPEPSPLLAYEIPDRQVDIAALQEKENEDIYAWITVPGTVIDYPVLQHSSDLDYYLDHNVDRSSGYPGCIYSQYLNDREWGDSNTVLYGHNMKNGSMFAGLHFYEDLEFLEENQYIYIFSENYVRVYHIFGAYEYDNRHLLLTRDMDDSEVFAAYLEEVLGLEGMRDNFLEEVSVSAEDKVLTLETCVYRKPEKRYIVQAVLEAEGEWPIVPQEQQ